ncbi:MAG: Gfo/Idh/MocA family oxidoreductase [Armatimonadetes bacterium]|nr:Gfo/Idh/MocA family oxidoreductase [Planctomycetota bacterium]MBI2201559.1 Gfo/Idh/MocA family oxidoreductase [Armatimonadota bacterium]
MSTRVRWGILGTGMVAGWLRQGFRGCQKAELWAVASRSPDRARAFAEKHQIPAAHGSYESLLADSSIEAVLVTLPNTLHREWVERSAQAGKHVLCEKPLAMSARDVQAMIEACRSQGVHLMEAAMYRFQPQIEGVLQLIRSGRIGQLRHVQAAFSWPFRDAANIRLRKDMGGGCLFDLGYYPISFAVLLAGRRPAAVMGSACYGDSDVEESAAALLHFDSGLAALAECGFRIDVKIHAEITGEEGRIILPDPWTARGNKKQVQVWKARKLDETLEFEDPNAYTREIDHFSGVVRGQGGLLWTPEESLRVIHTLEAVARSSRTGESVALKPG